VSELGPRTYCRFEGVFNGYWVDEVGVTMRYPHAGFQMTVGLAPTARFACRVVLEVGHNGPIGHVEQRD
jgi:hypothetical protein